MQLLTTKEAGKILGVTAQRVLFLINEGRLPAKKIGRDFVIQKKDLKLVANRKPGRPPFKKKRSKP